MFKKFALLFVLLVVVSVGAFAGDVYERHFKVMRQFENLTENCTCYTLTATTKTVVEVDNRTERTGGYVVNLSTVPLKITPINHGSTGNTAALAVRSNGMVIWGSGGSNAAPLAPSDYPQNVFVLPDGYSGKYYITSYDGGDTGGSTLSSTVLVLDSWR